ncbi:MAG: endonuclease/exonuclease/phosphatase family protein [Methylococcales bacterium]
MQQIQLLYIENNVSRKKRRLEQTLCFYVRVENLSYQKNIAVIWAGADGIWRTLAAQFQHKLENHEFWLAQISFEGAKASELPGNIKFGLRYQVLGREYWDNRNGDHYHSAANSGVQLGPALPMLNMDFNNVIVDAQKLLPIRVAVDANLHAQKVVVHWTTDNWQHSRKTACHQQKQSLPAHQFSAQVWTASLKVEQAFRLQYCVYCETEHQQFWDNHYGKNYSAARKPLKVMILNLHCYQEDRQDDKFSQIAKAINDLEVDLICLQEVAEHWNNGHGDWPSNSANIIQQRLDKDFHLYTDWSHLGFDKYREGVAILSRFPLLKQEARYVSNSHDIYSIHSRKVVMAQIKAPGMGLLNVFSAHLSWWEDGFAEQFQRLSRWAADKHGKSVQATLLCGDFNIEAGSLGYDQVVKADEYEDQFLAANAHGVFEKIFKVHDPHWQHYLSNDFRIDYIFMNKTSTVRVTSAMVLFTEHDYGRVSDHCGYVMTFEPN